MKHQHRIIRTSAEAFLQWFHDVIGFLRKTVPPFDFLNHDLAVAAVGS